MDAEINVAAQDQVPGQREGSTPCLAARWNGRGDIYPSVSPRLAFSCWAYAARGLRAPRHALSSLTMI
jgi:hypothetical protein